MSGRRCIDKNKGAQAGLILALLSALPTMVLAEGISRVAVSDDMLRIYPDHANPASGHLVAMEFGDRYGGDRGWTLDPDYGGNLAFPYYDRASLTFTAGTSGFGPVLHCANSIRGDQVRHFALRARVSGFTGGSTLPVRIATTTGSADFTLRTDGQWETARVDLSTIAGWGSNETVSVRFGAGGNLADYKNAEVRLDWISINDSASYGGGLDYTRFDQLWKLGYPRPVYSGPLDQPIELDRFSSGVDRMYQRFLLVDDQHIPIGKAHYVDNWDGLTYSETGVAPLPVMKSINGVDSYFPTEVNELNSSSTKINVLARKLVGADGSNFEWVVDGIPVALKKTGYDDLVAQIKAHNDLGLGVYLVMLNVGAAEPQTSDNPLIPSEAVYDKGNFIGQNSFDPLGRLTIRAMFEYLAYRLSGPGNGAVTGYIIGNEVDAHPVWHQVGPLNEEEFIQYYASLMRLCDLAIRKYNPYSTARASFTHHWTEPHTLKPRVFLPRFNEVVRSEGNFHWGVAYHPYPESNRSPVWWDDDVDGATIDFEAKYITYKNIEVLPQFLSQADFLYHGKMRPLALTEQGFNSDGHTEAQQAAAYAYAHRKLIRIPQIEAHVYHGYKDINRLDFGLVTSNLVEKEIFPLFVHADDPDWRTWFDPYLSELPITSWDEAVPTWGSFDCDFNEDGFAHGWSAFQQIDGFSVLNGMLRGTASGADPQLRMDSFFAATDVAPRLMIRMRSDQNTTAKLFWQGVNDVGFASARSFTFDVVGDNVFHEYEVMIADNAAWPGQMLQGLRFDPVNGAVGCNFMIDYIKAATMEPVIETIRLDGTQVALNGVRGIAGDTYSVRSVSNLVSGAWSVVDVGTVDAGGVFSITNAVNSTDKQRFYKVTQP